MKITIKILLVGDILTRNYIVGHFYGKLLKLRQLEQSKIW